MMQHDHTTSLSRAPEAASRLVLLAVAAASHCVSCLAAELPYPNRPIRLIVPYPPGAGTDFTGREIAQKLTEALGQQVVIDNRPGAGATLGHTLGARAAPDGYTLLLGTTGGLVSGPALGMKVAYDPVRDFSTIGLATYVPYSLVVTPGLPAKSVRELFDLARATPGKLNFSSPGVGTPNHVGGAQLMVLTGIELLHVPYKGSSVALSDLIAGSIHLTFTGLLQVLPHSRTGRLRILGVGHTQRLKALPDLPAINETVPGFYNTGWWGLVGPAGMPRELVTRLNAIMSKGLASPETAKRFFDNGLEVATSTPQGYLDIIRTDLAAWRKLIKDAGITAESLP